MGLVGEITKKQVVDAIELLNQVLQSRTDLFSLCIVNNEIDLPRNVQLQKTDRYDPLVGEDAITEMVMGLKPLSRLDQIVDLIYNEYPRKRDPGAARKAIMKALRDSEIPVPISERADFLLERVQKYAAYVVRRRIERDYIPYPATWFNRKSYLNA